MNRHLPLFIYGTLLDDGRRKRVLGRPQHRQALPAARLMNYQCRRVFGGDYPAIRPATGAKVDGALLAVRGPREWQRLIAYETAEYVLRRVWVLDMAEARRRPALCFIARERLPLTRDGWDLEGWRHRKRSHTRWS